MKHLSMIELEEGMPYIRKAPSDDGTLEMIVRRPAVDERIVEDEGRLTASSGLEGDNWSSRSSTRTPDGSPHPDMQLTLMGSRVISHLAGDRERWPLAGDQLFVDLDLGAENLPPGTRLGIGDAVIEITEQPHTGCAKFAARFGKDALKFVNTPEGRKQRLRGIYARVITPGAIHRGDRIRKLPD